MTSTTPATPPSRTERVDQRLRAHQEEVARLRAQIGDPQAALFRFVVERFDVQALVPDDQRGQEPSRTLWEDDDELDGRQVRRPFGSRIDLASVLHGPVG